MNKSEREKVRERLRDLEFLICKEKDKSKAQEMRDEREYLMEIMYCSCD